MHYLINKNSDVRYVVTCDEERLDLGIDVLPIDKIFNEGWFRGYKKCTCCDQIVATFLVKVNETTRCRYYLQTDAENVVEIEGGELANAA